MWTHYYVHTKYIHIDDDIMQAWQHGFIQYSMLRVLRIYAFAWLHGLRNGMANNNGNDDIRSVGGKVLNAQARQQHQQKTR